MGTINKSWVRAQQCQKESLTTTGLTDRKEKLSPKADIKFSFFVCHSLTHIVYEGLTTMTICF